MSQSRLFPDAYATWLSSRLPGAIDERLATCDQCAMEKPVGLTRDPGPFDPTLKCCTYFPFVPNFGVAQMLMSHPEAARVRLPTAAKQGILLPLGLFPSPEREKLAGRLGEKAFGRARELLCPFYDVAANGCSVWTARPAVCTTYFCKSVRDEEGLEFWADVESYLNHFEWTLANEIIARLGFDEASSDRFEAVMLEEAPGPERDFLVDRAWGEWREKKAQFFLECARVAKEVSPDELNELLGSEALDLEESIRERTSL